MYFATLGLVGILIFIFIALAEFARDYALLGFIAGVMMILLGIWMAADPVMIQTGSVMTNSMNQSAVSTVVLGLTSTNTTTTSTQTETYKFTAITTPFFDFRQISFGVLFLLGLYMMVRYGTRVDKW